MLSKIKEFLGSASIATGGDTSDNTEASLGGIFRFLESSFTVNAVGKPPLEIPGTKGMASFVDPYVVGHSAQDLIGSSDLIKPSLLLQPEFVDGLEKSSKSITRSDIVLSLVKISILSIGTFYLIKWMMKQLDPTNKQKKVAATKAREMLSKLDLKDLDSLSEYELMIASQLMDPSDIKISWTQIGGLSKVIREIKETVILPVRRRDLFLNSVLTQPPKGVLLHGPPGCGKTMIAKATAKESGTRFINLDVSILTDKWYGESQKLASAVFSLAVKIQPCIIFIDEIDSFLRSRNTEDHEATAMMKAQFMTLWDGISTDPNCTVIVMGATNRPNDLDKAILRRMPATFHIGLPDIAQRKEILHIILDKEPLDRENVDFDYLAKFTEGFSGSDLKELCRNSTMYRIQDFMVNNYREKPDGELEKKELGSDDCEQFHESLRPITMEDLKKSLNKMKEAKVNTSSLCFD